jgi:metal-responsive CopG/Arc/MetJ family transcriptional regulator
MVKNGNTTESVSVSLPSNLIQLMDMLAGKLDVSRSDFVKKAIKAFISLNLETLSGQGAQDFWDQLYKETFNRS